MSFGCLTALVAFVVLATPVPATEITRTHDVVYGRKFGLALTMDVWKPANPNGAGLLFMVSGAFKSGIELINPEFFDPVFFNHYLDRGYTIFLVNHGAQPKFTVAEAVADVQLAVRFIRVHASEYGVEPNRLGVFGASSGGYLALMIGAAGNPGNLAAEDPIDRAASTVRAVACFCPPSDWVNYGQPGRSITEYETVRFVWPAFGVQGKPKDEQTKLLSALSPINLVTRDMPPTLILHGDADVKVPYEQSTRLAAKMAELDVPHQLITREGGGHVWQNMLDDHAILADWFDKHLLAPERRPLKSAAGR